MFLPSEIHGALPSESVPEPVDIESLDFFSDRRFVRVLMEREDNSCFYCMRPVRPDTYALDHVVPQVTRLDYSYRNVVVACHDCNSQKREADGRDFLRSLYRSGVLSQSDLTRRLHALDQLEAGALVPDTERWPTT